jgi:hypothetical protein
VHFFAQLGDELKPMGNEQLLSQRLGEIAFIAEEFAYEAFRQLGNGMPIIDVAWRQAERQDLALIVDAPVVT